MGILPENWSSENLARLRSLPDIDVFASSPVVLAAGERAARLALEAQRGELAKLLHTVLYDEILFETDRAFGTDNTRASYRCDFKRFREWCLKEQLPFLPTSPEVLAHYVIQAAVDGVKLKRLKRIVAAVAFIHDLKDAPFRAHDVIIRAALRWVKRKRDAEAEQLKATASENSESEPKPEPIKTNGSGQSH